MKTYNRYSSRTLRAHHIVKLSLILTLFAFILISRRESLSKNTAEPHSETLRTAAERLASFRAGRMPEVSSDAAQELSGWSGLPHEGQISNTIRPQIRYAQRLGEKRRENALVQLDRPLAPSGTVSFRGHPAHPSRVIVQLKAGLSRDALETTLDSLGARLDSSPTAQGWATIELPAPGEAEAGLEGEALLMAGMKALQVAGVTEVVEPDYLLSHSVTPGDQAFAEGWLWGLHNTGQNGGVAGVDLGAPTAWDTTTGSADLIVAVIDTGIRYTHQDLVGQMWVNPGEVPGNGVDDDGDGYVDNIYGIDAVNGDGDPMDDNSHGTHCAGTIGAAANDGYATVGVAWEVQLMACKFLSADGWGYVSGAVNCIDFAVAKGARVLSNSWGGGGHSQALYDAIARARDAGVLFVAAAGNSATDTDSQPHYPSGYDLDNIISVAAVDRRGDMASWSNYGRNTVDLGAPGVDIFSTVADSDSSYAYYSGTSMAAPHVSGVAALVLATDENLGSAEVRARLLNTTSPLSALDGRTTTGGMVHAAQAVGGGNDDMLELSLSVSENPLRAGAVAALYARVTDDGPVLQAAVSGTLNGDLLAFADDGNAPDEMAGDGVYSAEVSVPVDISVLEAVFEVNAEAVGKSPASARMVVPVTHAPPNDHFNERAGLTGRRIVLADYTNRGATTEEGERRHYYVRPQKTVWFTWTAPRNGRADLWLRGSDFDTVLAVYRGSSLNSLRRVARNDDYGQNLTSRVRFNVRRGRTYQFVVDGWGGDEGDIAGRLVVKKRKPFTRGRKWWQW